MNWPVSKQNWGDASECNTRINGETFTVQMGECDAVIVSLGASIEVCEQKAIAISALPDCIEALKAMRNQLDYVVNGIVGKTEIRYTVEDTRRCLEQASAALKKAGCL